LVKEYEYAALSFGIASCSGPRGGAGLCRQPTSDHAQRIRSGDAGGDNDTSLFAGLTWTFGSGGPGLGGAFGVVYSEVDAGGDVSGGILSLNFDLQGRGTPVDFRVVGFAGNDDVAGQLGVGFTLDGSDVFGLLGFLTNHTQGGLTFGFDGDVGGFLGIHSHEFLEPRMTLQAPVMNDPQQIMLTRPGGV
jgi:hypothetical protein